MNTFDNTLSELKVYLNASDDFTICPLCLGEMNEGTVYMHNRCWQIIEHEDRRAIEELPHQREKGGRLYVVVPAKWRENAESGIIQRRNQSRHR